MATLAEKDTTSTLTPGEGEEELLGRRTRGAKVFHRVGTRQYRIGATIGPVHYRRDPFDKREELKEIDLSLTPTPGEEWDFACETNGYQVRVWNSREEGGRTLRCVAQFRRAGRWFEMAPVALAWMNGAGERELIAKPVASEPTVEQEPDRVLWRDAFGAGLDFCYTLTPDHFWKAVIVRERTALPRPTIGLAGLRLVVVMAVAWDRGARAGNGFAETVETVLDDDEGVLDAADEELSEPEEFDYRDTADRPLWWLRKPRAWDSREEEQAFEMGWRLRRRGGSVRMLLGLDARVLADESVTYPVYIDASISEEQISAGADDAEQYGSTFPGQPTLRVTGSNVRLGAYNYFYQGGFRFQGIPIPAGATIDSAKLSLCDSAGYAYVAEVYIACEDVDDGAEWSTSHTVQDGYTARTSARVAWNPGNWELDSWHDTPDLTSPVQEVVDRGGWGSGNNLNFLIYNRSSTPPGVRKYYFPWGYDGDSAKAAKFNCSYTEPPPAGGDWLFASD